MYFLAHESSMHKVLVNSQDSCACTRFLCKHTILAHAQESGACTRILCMRKNLVHAQDSCACTPITSKIDVFCPNTFFHEWAPYGRWGCHPAAKIRVVAMRVFLIFCWARETFHGIRIRISRKSSISRGRELRFGSDSAQNIFFMKFITKSILSNT